MDVKIKEVTTFKDLKSFIRFPHMLYCGNSNWVPSLFSDEYRTLRQDKNPAFENCQAKYWLAFKQERVVGRIAGIINQLHIEKWKQRYMRFGWVDFVDDLAVSGALFKTVESWAGDMGMAAVHGPLGFTDMDPEGMLVEGFEELGTRATIYNYPYYVTHMEKMGFVKHFDWVEYEILGPVKPNETISRIADIVTRRYKLKKLEVRNKKDLLPYAKELFQLLDDEYQHLYPYVPLTKSQVDAYIKHYFGSISPDFVPIVVDGNNRMVAFGISIPSLSRALQKAKGRLFPFGFIHLLKALRKNTRMDLYLMAVRSDFRGKGVNALLIDTMHRAFHKFGIIKAESNPELETNRHVQEQWEHFDKRQHKRRRCFIKYLNA
ncbi:MAG: hypothetical protein NTZ78_04235 [Candidatus Aureabacteria bacterium]|nr:hypothetical protein [Candidatus Auribacterota bacterium]